MVKHKKDELFIIHFNVQSLQKNTDNLTTFLANISEMPDIIAFSETKITYGQTLVNVNTNGYDFIQCDSTTKADGVGIYIKQALPCKQKFDININLSFVENIWMEVKVTSGSLVVGVIYRHSTLLVNGYKCFTTNGFDFLLNYEVHSISSQTFLYRHL